MSPDLLQRFFRRGHAAQLAVDEACGNGELELEREFIESLVAQLTEAAGIVHHLATFTDNHARYLPLIDQLEKLRAQAHVIRYELRKA